MAGFTSDAISFRVLDRKGRRLKKKAPKKPLARLTIPKLRRRLGVSKPEIKIVDTVSAPTNISATLNGLAYGLDPSQGLTNLDRVGRSIVVKSYKFRMTIYPDPAATDGGEVRMIWIRQSNPNTSLQSPANTLQTVTNIHSPYQFDQVGYKVLYDKTFSFSMTDFRNKYLAVSLPGVKDTMTEWLEADTIGNSTNLVKGYIRGFIMYNGFGGTAPSYDLYQRCEFMDS